LVGCEKTFIPVPKNFFPYLRAMIHPVFKKFLFGLLLVTVQVGFSQIELKNRVVDFTTFLPIESASIYIENTTIGTVSNVDGKFVLSVPEKHASDTLVISSIGYKSFRSAVNEFDNSEEIFLEEDIASLDEVLLVAETRPKTGNDIVLRALERLERNMPDQAFLQKAFLRHRERNKNQYKWLIESALTFYDSTSAAARDYLKINVDEVRKSYDLRDVDSLFTYLSYLRAQSDGVSFKSKKLLRDTIETSDLVKAIKWNDTRINGLDNLFRGKLNLVRNSSEKNALFGGDLLTNHQFELDTVLVDDGKKLYKIRIAPGKDYVGLNTENMYNEGFEARGWIYIYWDNFAIKKIEYELLAASENQKRRSKSLFNTLLNHKLVITYKDYDGKMYPSYIYYETPKLINAGDRSSDQHLEDRKTMARDEQFYYTIQEILFTEIIQDTELVKKALEGEWSQDIFMQRPYHETFWENYNVLLESEEEEKLIQDLSKRATLFKE